MQVELALSGCSSKLTAHLGFLQGLQDHRVGVTRIRASSGGALIAAMWASGLPLSYLETEFARIDFAQLGAFGIQDYFRVMFSGYLALSGSDNLRELLDHYLDTRTLGDLKIPLEVMVSNMTHGELKVLSSEVHPGILLSDAVYMSCLIPGYFRPHIVRDDPCIYRDGSIYKDFPIDLVGDPSATRVGHKVESVWAPTVETSPWTAAHELALVLHCGVDANGDASVMAVADKPNVICAATLVDHVSSLDFSVSAAQKEEMRLAGHRTGSAVATALYCSS